MNTNPKDKIDIPDEWQQVCRDLAEVAQRHGLRELSGKFHPPHSWAGEVSFSWAEGRHGEDSNEIKIASSFFVYARIKQNPQP